MHKIYDLKIKKTLSFHKVIIVQNTLVRHLKMCVQTIKTFMNAIMG